MADCASLWKSWIDERNRSAAGLFMKAVLSFASFFYGAAVRARNWSYAAGFLKIHKVSTPVISVGNLSLGGTGKTTLVLWCAQTLLDHNKSVAILSRGYGRNSKGPETLIVLNGESGSEDAAGSGDEPVLLAKKLKGVPVIVGADRVRSANLAIQKFNPDVLLLDDGFQHRRLHRDLDILCFDENIFRLPYLFPRGVLREPFSEISRADRAVMKSQNAKISRPFTIGSSVYQYRVREVQNHATGEILRADWLKGRKVFAASAIANPESFEALLVQTGAVLAGSSRFPDHFSYQAEDLDALLKEAHEKVGMIMMTEKDSVKLPKKFPAMIVGVEMDWLSGKDDLEQKILDAIRL